MVGMVSWHSMKLQSKLVSMASSHHHVQELFPAAASKLIRATHQFKVVVEVVPMAVAKIKNGTKLTNMRINRLICPCRACSNSLEECRPTSL